MHYYQYYLRIAFTLVLSALSGTWCITPTICSMKSTSNKNHSPFVVNSLNRTKHVCRYDGFCSRVDCIYRHTQRQQKTKSTSVCLYHISSGCAFGDRCRYQHPSGSIEQHRVTDTQCMAGPYCSMSGCIYNHGHLSQLGNVKYKQKTHNVNHQIGAQKQNRFGSFSEPQTNLTRPQRSCAHAK